MYEQLDPVAIAENDALRSEYVRRVHSEQHNVRLPTSEVVPRVLVQFWDNAEAIPVDVAECLSSWSCLVENHGFERLLFDDASATEFISENFGRRHLDAFGRCRHPAMRADYFRLCFISKNGGFYVDADDVYEGGDVEKWLSGPEMKVQPLCYEISTDSMIAPDRFLADLLETSDRIYYVNNNQLIAPPSHPIVEVALERATKLLIDSADEIRDIQSTTGPGNLTASLVRYAAECESSDRPRPFVMLQGWDAAVISKWPLDYRSDDRNWRLWVHRDA